MWRVCAYDKDADVEVLLASLSSYDLALGVASACAYLVKMEIIRRPEHTNTFGGTGEPFDWVFISHPNGDLEIIAS